MGKKESKNKAGLYALKGPKDNTDVHLAKQLATEAQECRCPWHLEDVPGLDLGVCVWSRLGAG